MKRLTAIALAATALASAQAQLQVRPSGNAPPPAPTAKPKPALQGVQRIKFILKQLDLNESQSKQSEALIETYYSSSDGKTLDIEMIRQLAKQMEDAQKAGNTAEVDKLSQQLKEIGQGSQDEPEFMENLKKVLNPDQQTELTETLDRLKANPSGSLRAIDVVRAARKLKLNDKQAADFDAAIAAFRTKVNDPAAARDATPPDARLAKQLDEFITSVRAVLAPDQAAKFDARVTSMKTDAAATPPGPTPVAPKPATP